MTNPQIENGHTDIANEIMEALARTRIPGEARQVLDYIMRKTWGWHKKEDEIPLSQLSLYTGINKQGICRALSKLSSMNIVIIKKDNVGASTYRINKHYDTWKPLPKKITVIEKDNKPLSKKRHSKENIQKKRKEIYKEKFSRRKRGEFQNVLLTDEEHERLVKDYGTSLVEDYIFKLGEYMKIHGKSYKDHNLTIRNWMRREGIGHINGIIDGKRIVEL